MLLLVNLNLSAQRASNRIECYVYKKTPFQQFLMNTQHNIENENYDEISVFCEEKVRVNINNIRNRAANYSKAQTKYIVKEFFYNNPLEKVQLLEEKDGLATFCCLGQKANYEIKFKINTTNEGYKISEIWVETLN